MGQKDKKDVIFKNEPGKLLQTIGNGQKNEPKTNLKTKRAMLLKIHDCEKNEPELFRATRAAREYQIVQSGRELAGEF